MDFLTVLTTVLSLMILAVPGFIIKKINLLPEKAIEAFSNLVLYVCQPFLAVMAFQKNYRKDIGINMLIVLAISVALYIIMIFIVNLLIKNKDNSPKVNCAKFASVFGNVGYMGIPFLQILFRNNPSIVSEVLIYGAVSLAVFNVFNWTFGVYMISRDKKEISFKKIIFNPVIIGVVIGFLLFIILKVPFKDVAVQDSVLDNFLEALDKSCNFLSDMVTPLAMMVIGMKLASVPFKNLFLDFWAYVAVEMKLVVMSLITMLCVAFLPISNIVKVVMVFAFSMPCATSTTLFAVRYKSDSDSASVMVLLSTILSVFVIPLTYLIMSGIFGITI